MNLKTGIVSTVSCVLILSISSCSMERTSVKTDPLTYSFVEDGIRVELNGL